MTTLIEAPVPEVTPVPSMVPYITTVSILTIWPPPEWSTMGQISSASATGDLPGTFYPSTPSVMTEMPSVTLTSSVSAPPTGSENEEGTEVGGVASSAASEADESGASTTSTGLGMVVMAILILFGGLTAL